MLVKEKEHEMRQMALNLRWSWVVSLVVLFSLNQSCQYFSDPDKVYDHVEIMPKPASGFASLKWYVTQNLIYPEEAKEQGISGKVLVQFVVNQDGSISEIEIIEGIGFGCDQESVRVILASAPWEPGLRRGEPVRVRLVLPVEFVLESNS